MRFIGLFRVGCICGGKDDSGMRKDMERKRQFVVLGLGRFGRSVAMTLYEMGYMVLGVDRDPALVQSISNHLTNVLQLDIRDADAMAELDLSQFDAAIIAVKDLESSLMATLICRDAGIADVLVKAIDERHARMAEKMGAGHVIFSERDAGRRTAHRVAYHNILEYVELDDIKLVEMKVPRRYVGKNLIELDLRKNRNLNVAAVRRNGEAQIPPDPKRPLEAEDQLVLLGRKESIEQFQSD